MSVNGSASILVSFFIYHGNGEVQKDFLFIILHVAAVEDAMLYRALITTWEGEV
jgi:hypothetical protein